jgi:hypothetical protein
MVGQEEKSKGFLGKHYQWELMRNLEVKALAKRLKKERDENALKNPLHFDC